jgi:hypothetical protein
MDSSRTNTKQPGDQHPIDSAVLAFVTTVIVLVVLHVLFS